MKYDFELNLDTENSLSLMINEIEKDSVILEFGPAHGRLTKYLKENMNCKVYLVELDEEAGKEALKFGEDLVVGDIEDYQWTEKYKDIKFDYIIFADVLEHLRNPLKVVKTAKEFLKDNGKILLSVPNLAHNSVLINLMNNNFEYTKVGLLDDTHIHFFTKNSLDKMVSDAGMYAVKEMATYADVGTIEIKNTLDDVDYISPLTWKSRSYGSVYQYVYVLSKEKSDAVKMINEYQEADFVQLYYDKDENWNSDHIIEKKIFVNSSVQDIEIDIPEEAMSLRFDPISVSGVIKIQEVYGINGDEKVEVLELLSNAEIKTDKTKVYHFISDDPLFVIKFKSPITKLCIKYEILDHSIGKKKIVWDNMTAYINDILADSLRYMTDNHELALRLQKETSSLVETKALYDSVKEQFENVSKAHSQILTEHNELCINHNKLQGQYNELASDHNSKTIECDSLKAQLEAMTTQRDILQAQRDQLESKKLYKLYKFIKRK